MHLYWNFVLKVFEWRIVCCQVTLINYYDKPYCLIKKINIFYSTTHFLDWPEKRKNQDTNHKFLYYGQERSPQRYKLSAMKIIMRQCFIAKLRNLFTKVVFKRTISSRFVSITSCAVIENKRKKANNLISILLIWMLDWQIQGNIYSSDKELA